MERIPVEEVTITLDRMIVSYSLPELSLTPAQEEAIRARLVKIQRRIERQVFGLPERDDPSPWAGYVPEREQPAPKAPKWGGMYPFGVIAITTA